MRPRAWIVVAGLLALALMLGLFAIRPWVLDRLELSLLDWRFRLRGVAPTTDRVALVTIDQKSVDEFGRWPWRRSVMARLIDRLSDAGVAVIGMDILFSEPEVVPETATLRNLRATLGERHDTDPTVLGLLDEALANADTDRLLAAAIARSQRTVLGYYFRTAEEDALGEEEFRKALSLVRKSQVAVARLPPEGAAPILTCTGVEPNIELFQVSARRLGFFSTLRDRDGVVRRAPLVAQCGGELHVSLALALLEIVRGQRAVVLGDQEGIRDIRLGRSRLSTDEGGKVLINFRGPPGTFPHYSAADVLGDRVPREALEGRIVLLGATEVGIGDVQTTPFGTVFPGVEILANVLDNLLAGNVLRRHDGLIFVELGALVLLGILVSLVVPRFQNAANGAGFVGVLLTLLIGATTYAFVVEGIWINVTYPALTLGAVYMAVAVTHGVTVDARARMIRNRFATYVPPEVVSEMINRPESFRLGGARRDLSILFSDVRDFTMLAEEIGPDDVSRLLNEYLTPMTQLVFESRGTLDKYIGDAIVAFWGAPLPVEAHPLRACECALAMQEGIARLRAERPELLGVDRLRVGIGIHAGEMVVGNMGSRLRFDYTVTGDGVNLCSRLEGLTKFYGVGIIASSDLVSRVEGFRVRELDTIRVKGKKESVRIFEILGRDVSPSPSSGFVESYAEGLRAYREGRWPDAERALREVLSMSGDRDGPSTLLLRRIEILKENPPPVWDGIWTFEQK